MALQIRSSGAVFNEARCQKRRTVTIQGSLAGEIIFNPICAPAASATMTVNSTAI